MALIPIPTTLRIGEKRKRKRTKRARPVKTPKSPEVKYRKQLQSLTGALRTDVARDIIPILKQFESEYVNDAYATVLEDAFDNLRRQYSDINTNAKLVANEFVDNTNTVNKRRFYSSVESAIGVNLNNVVQDEGLGDILTATTRENVALIRSIPEEYFKKIETLVFTSTTQGGTAGSMISEIRRIGKTTTKRAKLIARDQSSKLNSAITQQRQQNLGVEEYVWRTSEDDRVRDNHRTKNGKTFRWDDPPKDTGHPGQDVQCRCVAQAIINI